MKFFSGYYRFLDMRLRITRTVTAFAVVFFLAFAQGCARKDSPVLQEGDKRFAAFYADYLVLSGISSTGTERFFWPGGDLIDSLFDVHGLTLESFNELSDTYRENPKRWRAVLKEVKNNLHDDDN